MTHGLMFHYFHNDIIKETQGSISALCFEELLDKYSKDHNLLSAKDYLCKIIDESICENDVCITFDDGLYSQYKVAEPILESKGLTAFYFVYTSPMEGKLEKIEVYRTFRNSYESVDAFYHDFFQTIAECGVQQGIDYKSILASDEAKSYHSQYAYYSENDRIFRYFRDVVLRDEYDKVMSMMMSNKGFNSQKKCKDIWISPGDLKKLYDRGNIIGLHSHTHPTTVDNMDYQEKYMEYSICKRFLENVIGGG